MSSIDSKGNPGGAAYQDVSGGSFESGLSRARYLIDKGDLNEAMEILLRLEARYVGAIDLFDLLGEVLLARGSVKEGIRYKTLHEILRGTFQVAIDEASRELSGSRRPRPSRYYGDVAAADGDPEIDDLAPVTPAMGQEFLRQGHFEQAVRVFDKLIARNPGDESLREAREIAAGKNRDRKLLSVFQRWLKNIERMKSHETSIS
ncbi:MAG: hypothetical protein RDU20_10145 [Desulfomonilaceae bacterium]|nr:hypothetical protein [Desulfomonilaceae bacterium]